MKRYLFLLAACLVGYSAFAQEQAETLIKEAQDLLAKKEYKQAQMSLQDAINAINLLIADQVAQLLPEEINGLKADGSSNAGSMGAMGGGVTISKAYSNPAKPENNADIQIIANSPMIAAMSMYLTNPAMMGPEYKSVRVGTQRAILKTEMEDYSDDAGNTKKIRSSELQLPIGQTLIMIELKGFATEQDELAFANKLDIEKLKTALGE